MTGVPALYWVCSGVVLAGLAAWISEEVRDVTLRPLTAGVIGARIGRVLINALAAFFVLARALPPYLVDGRLTPADLSDVPTVVFVGALGYLVVRPIGAALQWVEIRLRLRRRPGE